MTHIRLDDGFGEHQKIACLSDLAFRLFVNGLGYCSRRETDGFIPKPLVGSLVTIRTGPQMNRAIHELTSAGLWIHREPVPREMAKQGYDVHDYLKYQRSKAQIDAQKEAGRARFQRWRNATSNGSDNVSDNGESNGSANSDLITPEGRGQRAEGRVRGSSQSDDEFPPTPPQAGGAERARKGSKRKRDVADLNAIEVAAVKQRFQARGKANDAR